VNLLIFAITELLLCLTPGPAVLLVISQAVRRGVRASTGGALGILAGNAIYFALSAVGLGALLIASKTLFTIVKFGGAAYLVYMGIVMILSKAKALGDDVAVAARHHFTEGVVTQLANPKAIVFFTALLPQFINPHGPIALQLMILGVISIVIELPVLLMYGLLADRGRAFLRSGTRVQWLDRIAGTFLVGAGVKLALARNG
jgi:homoserine/homoserine lactone efflux protein